MRVNIAQHLENAWVGGELHMIGHVYGDDLNIAGQGSLFQRLRRLLDFWILG